MKSKFFFAPVLSIALSLTANAQWWSLTGNGSTNPPTNFLGTTDAKYLLIKVNNVKSGITDYDVLKGNTSFGYNGQNANTGTFNTSFGYDALKLNTTATDNTAVGFRAMQANTTGTRNTAIGSNALYSNTTSNGLTAVGSTALYNNTSGEFNTGVGQRALNRNTSGKGNTAVGDMAIFYNTTGSLNTGVGDSVLFNNISTSGLTAVGYRALFSNTAGDMNTAIGCDAMYNNRGSNNTAIGYRAMISNTYGGENVAIGDYAMRYNTTGFLNVAIGTQSMEDNTDGSENTAVGQYSLKNNTTGDFNTAIGGYAMNANSTGIENTALGDLALDFNSTGNDNVAIGHHTLHNNTSGSFNTAIGTNADVSATNFTNTTVVGYLASGTASNQVRIGNTSVTSIGGQVGWTTLSDGRYKKNIKENIPGLLFINKLRPVTYNFDMNGINQVFSLNRNTHNKISLPIQNQGNVTEGILSTGFIAQEVEAAAKEIGYEFDGVDRPKNKDDFYGLRYAEFVVPLVKSVQELSSQNDKLKAVLELQNKINNNLQNQIDEMKRLVLQKGINSLDYSKSAILDQNIPNPYSSTTIVRYYLPLSVENAALIISNAEGKSLKEIKLVNKGTGQVTIDAGALSAGSYFYTLIVDGINSDTKKFIVTK